MSSIQYIFFGQPPGCKKDEGGLQGGREMEMCSKQYFIFGQPPGCKKDEDCKGGGETEMSSILQYIFFACRLTTPRRTRTASGRGDGNVFYIVYILWLQPPGCKKDEDCKGGGETEMSFRQYIFFGYSLPAARRTRTARGRGNGNA